MKYSKLAALLPHFLLKIVQRTFYHAILVSYQSLVNHFQAFFVLTSFASFRPSQKWSHSKPTAYISVFLYVLQGTFSALSSLNDALSLFVPPFCLGAFYDSLSAESNCFLKTNLTCFYPVSLSPFCKGLFFFYYSYVAFLSCLPLRPNTLYSLSAESKKFIVVFSKPIAYFSVFLCNPQGTFSYLS